MDRKCGFLTQRLICPFEIYEKLLGVRPQTINAAVYGELGRVPLNIVRKERILQYWLKIRKSERFLINKLSTK